MRYPLVEGQGNFGSVDGDPPAAYRYTEARMSKMSVDLMRDIEKDTVDFVPNFDESKQEPSVLPCRVPNLLINGSSGIAVGMATNIPPHNMREVIDGIVDVYEAAASVPHMPRAAARSRCAAVLPSKKNPTGVFRSSSPRSPIW